MLCDSATGPRRAASRAAVPASDFGAATHWGTDGNDGWDDHDSWDDVEDHRAHRFADLGFTDPRRTDPFSGPAPLRAPKGGEFGPRACCEGVAGSASGADAFATRPNPIG